MTKLEKIKKYFKEMFTVSTLEDGREVEYEVLEVGQPITVTVDGVKMPLPVGVHKILPENIEITILEDGIIGEVPVIEVPEGETEQENVTPVAEPKPVEASKPITIETKIKQDAETEKTLSLQEESDERFTKIENLLKEYENIFETIMLKSQLNEEKTTNLKAFVVKQSAEVDNMLTKPTTQTSNFNGEKRYLSFSERAKLI